MAMERKSYNNSLKDHGAKSIRAKEIAEKNNGGYGYAVAANQDYLAGFSWPPRSYTCSFCKREFRSAQALGGHMNVHRRDRARLRDSPSNKDKYSFLNLNPKPKPIFSFASPSPSPHPFSSTPLSPPPSSAVAAASSGVWGLGKTIYPPFSNKGESILPFDLKIGLFCGRSEEDLDLELRLGYS